MERVYFECRDCAYGVSGDPFSPGLLTLLDRHLDENPRHSFDEHIVEEDR